MKRLLPLLAVLLLWGCGQEVEMPEVVFLSPDAARVEYQGRSYVLVKDQPPPPDFPLEYRFEEDGDLDLRLGGRWVEFDNPFDLDLESPFKVKKLKRRKKALKGGYAVKKTRRKRR